MGFCVFACDTFGSMKGHSPEHESERFNVNTVVAERYLIIVYSSMNASSWKTETEVIIKLH